MRKQLRAENPASNLSQHNDCSEKPNKSSGTISFASESVVTLQTLHATLVRRCTDRGKITSSSYLRQHLLLALQYSQDRA